MMKRPFMLLSAHRMALPDRLTALGRSNSGTRENSAKRPQSGTNATQTLSQNRETAAFSLHSYAPPTITEPTDNALSP